MTSTGGGPPADITSLIATLGGTGSPNVKAFYDGRYGITQAAGVVSAWADATGQFQPLVINTAVGPTISGSVMSFNGSTQGLGLAVATTALNPVTTDLSIIVVGSLTASGGNNIAAVVDATALHTGFSIGANSSSFWSGRIVSSGTSYWTPTAAATGATTLVGFQSAHNIVSTSANGATQVPNEVQVTETATGGWTGYACYLGAGCAMTAGGIFGGTNCTVSALLVLGRSYNSTDVTNVLAWAEANHGATTG